MKLKSLLSVPLFLACTVAFAQKKPLDQSAYDGWKAIKSTTLSDDGAWAYYTIDPQRGDGVLEFYNIPSGAKTRFERGSGPAYFNSGTWARFTIVPRLEAVRQAKIKKVKKEDMPKDTAAIVRLSDMSLTRLPGAKGLTASAKGPLVVYSYEIKQKADSTTTDKDKKKELKYDRLVIFDVMKGDSVTVDSVKSFAVNEPGNAVLYSLEADSVKSVYLYRVSPKQGAAHTELWTSKLGAVAPNFTFDRQGEQGAFLVTSDTLKNALYDLYYFRTADAKPVQIKNDRIAGLPQDYAISRFGSLSFHTDGTFLQLNIAPRPKPEPKPDSLPDNEKFSLDLWSGSDTILMPQQIKDKRKIAETVYSAIYYPKENRALALGDYNLESIRFAENGDAPYAIGVTNKPYIIYTENNVRPYIGSDTYLIDLKTGKRTQILQNSYGGSYLSPSAKFVGYYSLPDSSWYAVDTKTLVHTRVTADIPYPFYNEDDDHPSAPPLYGFNGWTTDEKMLIPDRYDLWLVDPTAKTPAKNLTGIGRETDTRFRFVNMNTVPGKGAVDLSKPMLFLSFNYVNKENGYYRLQVGNPIQRLVEGPYIYTLTSFAKDPGADRIIYTRQNFNEFPDLWTSNELFQNPVRMTDANPQQADYLWGSVELIKWTDLNGNECEGLLNLPENYDPSKRYPTIVYFYETQTFLLYRYNVPAPSRSIINPVYCTSNDYVVFIPDIKYRDGLPGKSCYDVVLGGTMALIERGIADPKHIGLQGQSWGGYQTAWLVTQTDLYACSAPGAAVSNMISAYGGIRWSTGISRATQYENGQSRIGATPWQRRDLYIDNSPVFFADRVTTPQLLRHSDQDGAVPWYQSIEYYIALRRLGKPVWLLNYSGDEHNLMSRAACMDWDKRMYQFFDHYLKDAPMPRWMEEGITVLEKNIDQKYELVE